MRIQYTVDLIIVSACAGSDATAVLVETTDDDQQHSGHHLHNHHNHTDNESGHFVQQDFTQPPAPDQRAATNDLTRMSD